MNKQNNARQVDLPDNGLARDSRSLYERHHDIYDKFFFKHSHVVSCPGTFFWAGEHAVLYGGLATCQHVPQRVYVGIEPLEHLGNPLQIELGSEDDAHQLYDPNEDRFKKASFMYEVEFRNANIPDKLNTIIKLLGLEPRHFIIRTLHELRPGAGCNWSGALSTALVGALLVYYGRLTPSILAEWKNHKIHELITDKTFNECHRKSWRLETAFHGGKASGYGTFSSLVSSSLPFCYATAKRGESSKYPIDVGTDLDILERIPYTGFRLSDEYPVREDSANGILCGLIYSGVTKDTAQSIDRTKEVNSVLEKAIDTVKKLNKTKIGRPSLLDNLKDSPFISQVNNASKGEGLRYTHVQSLISSGTEMFQNLCSLFCEGVGIEGKNLISLCSNMRGINGNLERLGLGWWESDQVIYLLGKCAEQLGPKIWEQVAAKPTGGSRGGQLLFIMPRVRDVELTLMNNLAKFQENNNEMSLDWLQTRDDRYGYESDGMRIEKPCENKDRFTYLESHTATLYKILPEVKTPVEIRDCFPTELERIRNNASVYLELDYEVMLERRAVRICLPSNIGALALALCLWRGEEVTYHDVLYKWMHYFKEKGAQYSLANFRAQFAKNLNYELRKYDPNFKMDVRRIDPQDTKTRLYTNARFDEDAIENYIVSVEFKNLEIYIHGNEEIGEILGKTPLP